MSLLQRMLARWWSLWAIARGVDVTRLAPLPPPKVDPGLPADELIAEADARGVRDAQASMYSAWSFGGPGEERAEKHDPVYVRQLRDRREAAIESLRAAQNETHDRIAQARERRDEFQNQMDDARTRMSGLAVRDALAEARALADHDDVLDPVEQPDDGDRTPWEGESTPLRLSWRLLILVVLTAAQAIVQYAVFVEVLGSTPDRNGLIRWMTVLTSAVVVLGPFLSGTLLRSRGATGGERRGWYAAAVLVASWLVVIVVFGLVRGQVLQDGAGRPGQAHVTPLTVVLMFVALMLVVGAMAFMLGLARRHPFQEAYVRSRTRRDRFELIMRTIATRLNPAWVEQPDGSQERAIREAYAAAEEAYFAALARTVGDPVFTEAVQHRRGLRTRP
ncbi:hypothetical protein [Actinoplanes italicus]|uniref:Uncharacterized protein n=1 Tax=Actinoplanes italicus TaxID=113567 RepID=A0A2T0K311_9ACTN|nr:hypothetical protein [Actinoplanes italicus]PRX17242.1 hypothetical protein CLV67_11618 [Actinoplanes italicus]